MKQLDFRMLDHAKHFPQTVGDMKSAFGNTAEIDSQIGARFPFLVKSND